MDAQVQVKLIEEALKLADRALPGGLADEAWADKKAELFSKYYAELLKATAVTTEIKTV